MEPIARVKVLKGLLPSDNKHTEPDSRVVGKSENTAESIKMICL